MLQENKDLVTQALKEKTKGSKHAPPEGPMTEMANVPDDTYIDGKRAARATEILKQLASDEKPFFFAVGFTKPHLPFVAPKKYWDLYDRESFSMPPNRGRPHNGRKMLLLRKPMKCNGTLTTLVMDQKTFHKS